MLLIAATALAAHESWREKIALASKYGAHWGLSSGRVCVLILGMTRNRMMIATLLAAGTLLAGTVVAQQTPAKATPAGTAKPAGSAAKTAASAPLTLTTEKQKVSYAIGADIGEGIAKSLERNDIQVDSTILIRAFKDAFNGGKLQMTDDEIKTVLTQVQKDARTKQEAKAKTVADDNKKEGEAFLAANKSKEGVVTLPDGLQYKVIKQGDGPKPTASDSVECNYRGTLISGKEFDSSYKRGQPATFGVGQVIKGWTEILQLMPVGSKYQVFVPSDLAYGPRAPGADIGPNSTLIFEVELLSIKSKAAEAPAPAEPAKPETATPATK